MYFKVNLVKSVLQINVLGTTTSKKVFVIIFHSYLFNEIVGDVQEELLDVLVELLVGVHLLHQLLQTLLVQNLMKSFAH